jgi:diketogulonate reductase-like aldo/keto reductase
MVSGAGERSAAGRGRQLAGSASTTTPDWSAAIWPARRSRCWSEHGILTQTWSPIGTFYRDGEHTSTVQDPVIGGIAEAHNKTPAQVMLRWHLQQGRSVIPKSTKPQRIAENLDVFDFDLATDELAAIDARDTGQRGGPEPEVITLESFGRPIPED